MARDRQELGIEGEGIAAQWLVSHGWVILESRFRSGHRDIDLIAARAMAEGGRTVAFVEVKARRSAQFGGPIAAVNWRKQRELARSASVWVARHRRANDEYRFDVIGVLIQSGRVSVSHIENAFSLPAHR